MKKIILLSMILIGLFAVSASAQTKVRVKFAKNQYQKTVTGTVNGSNYIDYVFRVNQYEFIEADLTSANKNIKFTVLNTKKNPMNDGVSVRNFSGEAEKTGDYTVRVFLNGKGNGNFRLKISAFMGT